jgi:hypothetical protein
VTRTAASRTSRTETEIIDQLRETPLLPSQTELLDELEEVMKVSSLWPLAVREAAEEALGGGIHNPKGRDHLSIDRRVRHAMKVFRARYGGLNPSQAVYAGEVLAWAIRGGGGNRAFIFSRLEKCVHLEEVHAGFRRRAGLVDVSAQLEEVAPSEAIGLS